jgi:hypothetical protein
LSGIALVRRRGSDDCCCGESVGFRRVVRVVYDDSVMGQNFISCDRGQAFLMPPSLTDWVPEDHLVWTVLGAVEHMDLDVFYGAYRANGQGRAAYDPAIERQSGSPDAGHGQLVRSRAVAEPELVADPPPDR